MIQFSFNFSMDNGRISLSTQNNRTCQLIIRNIKEDDKAEWQFSIQYQQNKTTKKNLHYIAVQQNGEKNILVMNTWI